MGRRATALTATGSTNGAERLTLVFTCGATIQGSDTDTLTTDAQPEVCACRKLALGLEQSRHRDRATSRGNLAERLIDCHALLREKLRTVFRM